MSGAKHPPVMWQARPLSGGGWREVSPTKLEPTVQQRVDYLRTVQRSDGTPAYEFRALVVSTPLSEAAPDLLAALMSLTRTLNTAGYSTKQADEAIAKAQGGAA